MADYNIYVHAIGTGTASQYNPTTSWSAREGGESLSPTSSQTSGGASGSAAFGTIIRAAGYASNPDSIISRAFSSLAKAFPIVAAAFAVVQLADGIITTATEFAEIETGDYRFGVKYQNFKTGVHIIFNPVSSTIQSFKTQAQWQRENYKLRAQRELLGDSVINSYTNRGV